MRLNHDEAFATAILAWCQRLRYGGQLAPCRFWLHLKITYIFFHNILWK